MFGIDDAIEAGIAAVGLGMQIFGSNKQAQVSHQMAQVSKDEAMHEQNINDLKQRQMELEGQRSQLETIRNMQRARALGISASVNQGANMGSGLAGGLAQVQNQGGWNILGINQGLEIGRGINTQNKSISADKMQMADLQGQSADAQGMQSMGGALLKSSGTIGSLGANAWGGISNSFFPGVQLPGMK